MRVLGKYLFLFASGLLLCCAQAREDQVWLTGDVSAALGKGFSLKVEELLKFDNHHFYATETGFSVGYQICPYFSVSLGHKIVRERAKCRGHFLTEQRPMLDLTLTLPEFCALKVDFRSRFELRDKTGAQAYLRYRERIRLRTSWKVTDFEFSPYLSEELFFSDKPKTDDADLFDRSRAQVGVTFKPVPSVKGLSASLYFMVQHDMLNRSSAWDPTNVYGFTLSYKF